MQWCGGDPEFLASSLFLRFNSWLCFTEKRNFPRLPGSSCRWISSLSLGQENGWLESVISYGWQVGMLLVLLGAAGLAMGAAPDRETNPQLLYRDAETYYWLGISDKRDAGAFRKGIAALQRAREAIEVESGAPVGDGPLQPDAAAVLIGKIDSLEADLRGQEALSRDAFVGRFPLVRFLTTPVFMRPDSFGSFEVVEEPLDIAAQNLASKLGKVIDGSLLGDSQVSMLVLSKSGKHPEMESMFRMMIKQHPRIKVTETAGLAGVLTEEDFESMAAGKPSAEVLAKLKDKLKSRVLAIVVIDESHRVEDIHFTKLTCSIFRSDSQEFPDAIVLYELVRDKRPAFSRYLIFVAALPVLGLLVIAVLMKILRVPIKSRSRLASSMVAAYLLGLLIAVAVIALLASLRPGFHDHMTYTAWWVVLTVSAAVWVPVFAIRSLASKFPWVANRYALGGRYKWIMPMAGMGAAATLCFGLFMYFDSTTAWSLAAGCVLLFAGAAALAGRLLDQFDRPSAITLAIAVLVLVPCGAWLVASGDSPLALATVGAANLMLLPARRLGRSGQSTNESAAGENPPPYQKAGKAASCQELAGLCMAPPYFETDFFRSLFPRMDEAMRRGHGVFCIVGPCGHGKSAMARECVKRLMADQHAASPARVLSGKCESHGASDVPYGPISRMLRDCFDINPQADAQTQLLRVDDMLGGIFKKVVPFSSLLLDHIPGGQPQVHSAEELRHGIVEALRNLAQKSRVIFHLEDLHLADQATLELLASLHAELAECPDRPVLFIYTARESPVVERLLPDSAVFRTSSLTPDEERALLRDSLGMESETADVIQSWARGRNSGDGNLFWLLKIVEHLARLDAFEFGEKPIRLKPEYLTSNSPPLPAEYRESLRREVDSLGEHEMLIAAAAIMGPEFRAGIVAQALGLDVLQCLRSLHEIEKKTSLIHDDLERDGVLAFASNFAHETVREALQLQPSSSRSAGVRQIVRELHFRIAEALRTSKAASVTDLAYHYAAAGDSHVETAIDHLVAAARHCISIFRYEEAREYLRKARERTMIASDPEAREMEITLCECEIAHQSGENREAVAETCRQLLRNPGVLTDPARMACLRALYDARAFPECREHAIAILEQSDDPELRAEAMHFAAISLPPTDPAPRREGLRKAADELTRAEPLKACGLRLRSRILNSLGMDCMRLAMDASASSDRRAFRDEAEQALQESIAIKKRPDINDVPGLAMSYGGLGHLHLETEPKDPPKAAEFFQKDLDLAQQIANVPAQTMMHSLLGRCALETHDLEAARGHYEKSLSLATSVTERFHAYLGYFCILRFKPDDVELQKKSEQLHFLLKEDKISGYNAALLGKVLEKYHSDSNSEVAEKIRDSLMEILES